MGLGQTMLTIVALGLLGTLFLTQNANTLDQRTVVESCEYEIMATSLATSIVERASGLSFDEVTVNSDVSSASSLSSSLGVNGTEIDSVETTFDDFDDYNNFHKIVKGDSLTFRSADFREWARVEYVTVTNDSVKTSVSRTFHKKLTVWVTSPMMRDTVTYSTVFSYWYFR